MWHLLRLLRRIALSALLPALLASGPAFAAEDLVLKGDANSTPRHNEDSAYPVLAIGKTRHGTQADARLVTCTGCHGESAPHTVKLLASEPRVKPDRYFGRKTTTPPAEQDRVCLACHQGGKRIHWQSGAHATHEVERNARLVARKGF